MGVPVKCIYPRMIRGNVVPCATCKACMSAKRWRYSARVLAETDFSERTWFVTLTMSDASLSSVNDEETLGYAEIQKMLKRLRKAGYRLRYAAVPERGEKNGRLHWHMIVHAENGLLWANLRKEWPHGFADVVMLSGKGMRSVRKNRRTGRMQRYDPQILQRYYARYVAKYVTKGDGRFRFSQGYGRTALLQVLAAHEGVFAVKAAWPSARVERVRLNGVAMPRKLFDVEGRAPDLPPVPPQLRADYISWRNGTPDWWKSQFDGQSESLGWGRLGWSYLLEPTAPEDDVGHPDDHEGVC